jgi:hypothetical protein
VLGKNANNTISAAGGYFNEREETCAWCEEKNLSKEQIIALGKMSLDEVTYKNRKRFL